MNITPYIYMFIPSLIGISFYKKLVNDKSKNFDVIRFLMYILLSNIFAFLFLRYFDNFNGDIFDKLINNSHYAFRYSLLLIVINFVVGILDFIRINYFDFEVEEKHGKKH